MFRKRFKSGLLAFGLAALPLATAATCGPNGGFSFLRFDEDEHYEPYYDDYYYGGYYYDDYYYDDCYYDCW